MVEASEELTVRLDEQIERRRNLGLSGVETAQNPLLIDLEAAAKTARLRVLGK